MSAPIFEDWLRETQPAGCVGDMERGWNAAVAALAATPFPTIAMGHGQYEVGAGKHADLPCIAFGKNGSGIVGEPITMEPRQMTVDETVLVITFANSMGLAVLQEKVDEVRENFFAGELPALPDEGVSHG
jgi:hypothetical protein